MFRRVRKNKRGMIFNIAVVIIVIIVLTYGYIRLSSKMDVKHEIGENPSMLVLKVQQGEKSLIFVDLAAKLALQQALFDLQDKGGVTSSTPCGEYYGFKMWNSDSGQTCFLDKKGLEKALQQLFEPALVARLASYPDADFLINTPQAASMARQVETGTPAVGPGKTNEYCSASSGFRKDFTFDDGTGRFPVAGARVWVPKEADCPGSWPLVVFLPGCESVPHRRFGDGDPFDVIEVAKNLYASKKIVPLIFASPSQTKFKGSNCVGDSLFSFPFDMKRFVDDVKKNLPEGVSVSSVAIVGHSAAGCSLKAGLFGAFNKVPDAVALGALDTCAWPSLFAQVRSKLGSSKLLVVYGTDRKDRSKVNAVLGATSQMSCPSETDYPGGEFDECYSDGHNIFTFTMKNPDDKRAVAVGMEQFLLRFFPASSPDGLSHSPVVGAKGCIYGQKVAAWGDSITAEKAGWVSMLNKRCPVMTFENLGVVGRWSRTGRKLFEEKVLSQGFDQVIIMFGMNDILGKSTAEAIESNLQAMYDAAKAKGLRVVAMTVTPAGPSKYNKVTPKMQAELDKLNAWILAKPENVDVVVNTWQPLNAGSTTKAANKAYIYPDNIHPNLKGHRILADVIYNTAFQPALPSPGEKSLPSGSSPSSSVRGNTV